MYSADSGHAMFAAEREAREMAARGAWVEHVSFKPQAKVFHRFLSVEECDALKAQAEPAMKRSTVVDSVTGEVKTDPIRTSYQTFLVRRSSEMVIKVDERIARAVGLPWYHGEDMQVLRYGIGQQYDTHQDVGEVSSKSGAQLASSGGHRAITCLLYFTDVEEGGETVFPISEWADEEMKEGLAGSFSKCGSQGVAVKPRKGDALLFFSLDENERVDTTSLHAGCPVIEGNKWSATKWMHIHEFGQGTKHARQHKNGKGCVDDDKSCVTWAAAGECEKNPSFMTGPEGACQKSCGHCHT